MLHPHLVKSLPKLKEGYYWRIRPDWQTPGRIKLSLRRRGRLRDVESTFVTTLATFDIVTAAKGIMAVIALRNKRFEFQDSVEGDYHV